MTELALTLLRLGFLVALWTLVLVCIVALRRDLRAPREARPLVAARSATPAALKPPRSRKGSRPKSGQLVVVEGPLQGTVIPLSTTPVSIGRAPASTLVLDDDYASTAHAEVSLVDGRWVVTDLGSTNGTWIGRTRITAPTALATGQQLRIGRTTLELRKR